MSKWDKFWRWFNPPLPDVMQAEMLKRVQYLHGGDLTRFVTRSLELVDIALGRKLMFEDMRRCGMSI